MDFTVTLKPDMTPEDFAAQAAEVAKENGIPAPEVFSTIVKHEYIVRTIAEHAPALRFALRFLVERLGAF